MITIKRCRKNINRHIARRPFDWSALLHKTLKNLMRTMAAHLCHRTIIFSDFRFRSSQPVSWDAMHSTDQLWPHSCHNTDQATSHV
jgi:hypothetical protein